MKDRREFIKRFAVGSFGALLGTEIVFAHTMPAGLMPIIFEKEDPYSLFNKNREMKVLNDRPWNIGSKAHLLDDSVTPNSAMFVRNNGLIPENIDLNNWTLTIDGESAKAQKTYSLEELKQKFTHHIYQ